MRPPTLPHKGPIETREEDASDAAPENMPVEKLASFQGRLNLTQFAHPTSVATGPATEWDGQARTSQAHDSPSTELRNERTTGYKARSTTLRSSRSRSTTSTSISTSSESLDLTLPPIARPPLTRSRTSSSSLSPPTRKPGSTPRARRQRTALSSTEKESLLRDTIPENLILLLVGVNPGIKTGETGFAYAHPTNLFWKLLHASGITEELHPPSDTYKLPDLYSVGNTNIVRRPTRDASMLSRQEMNEGVPKLEYKVATQRPLAVCLVGKGIWEAVWRVQHGRPIRKEEFRYGWQDPFRMGRKNGSDWDGARVFVATTTSGVSTNMTLDQRKDIWRELGEWVRQKREERKHVASLLPSDGPILPRYHQHGHDAD